MSKGKIPLEEEKKLVELAKKDLNAFGLLYDMYIDEIYIFILYRVGSREDAEDMTAVVFEKAMKNLKNFEWQGFSFGAWLYTIARNQVIDSYKKKGKTYSSEEILKFVKDDEQEDPADITKKILDKERTMKALLELPEDQREIVYLRYVKDMTIQETMEITQKTIDSVKSLAKRGISTLRNLLNQN